MTKERLVEAVNFLNPETGIQDLIVSAKKTIQYLTKNNRLDFYRGEKTHFPKLDVGNERCCVLARGWKDGHNRIEVNMTHAELDGECINHSFIDVVRWFDCLRSDLIAAESVLALLEENND